MLFSFSTLAATCAIAAPASNSTIIADFSANQMSGIAPLTVHFSDFSTGNPAIQNWNWSFGDGNTSTEKNPIHTYNSAGKYTVRLTVRNSEGDNTTTKSNYISVTAALKSPVAAFSASPTSGNSPLTVSFTDKSTGSPISWSWSFGDGSTSTEKNPTHIYNGVGKYTASLTVNNAAGSSLSSSVINVSSAPAVVADFSSNITSGKVPLTVQFRDRSTGNPVAFSWDFGDGASSTQRNPLHTYSAVGTYTVTLRADRSTTTKANYVTVDNGGSNGELKAAFTASPSQGAAPLTVQFTDTSIGTPTTWSWDFGDSTSSALQNPAHTYNLAGNYSVKLTVMNNFDSSTSQVPFFVNVLSASNPTPIADFNSNINSGNAPLTVQFNDASTGNPTSWEWDFNSDRQVDSNEKNPTYEFTDPGSYSVTLRAGNSAGFGNITKTNYITVGKATFQASFTASPVQGIAPLSVQFTDTSTGDVTSRLWDFGDETTSVEQNPTHTYSAPGTYSVTLSISNADQHSELTFPEYISVTEVSGDSSSGGGSSSSDTDYSPEPTSNIEAKLQVQRYIAAGSHTKFEFTKNANSIYAVEFDSERTFGNTRMTIEQLKDKSDLTTAPMEKVLKYLNIWVGNNGTAVTENMKNATIEFAVSKDTLKTNEILESTVILQRYDQGKWNRLNTMKIGEDKQFIYYKANTTGFSSFAITLSMVNAVKEIITLPNDENLSKQKNTYNDVISLQDKQPEKSQASNATGWQNYSGPIIFSISFIVVLIIGLRIKERMR